MDFPSRFPNIDKYGFDAKKYSAHIVKNIVDHEQKKVEREINEYKNRQSVKYWLSLGGYEFEDKIADLYASMGYLVRKTPKSGDGGVDLVIRESSTSECIYIQCKNHRRPVAVNVVRELKGVMSSGNIKKGILICSSGTTEGGRVFANENNIQIITVYDIVKMNASQTECDFCLDVNFVRVFDTRAKSYPVARISYMCVMLEVFLSEKDAEEFANTLLILPPENELIRKISSYKIEEGFRSVYFYYLILTSEDNFNRYRMCCGSHVDRVTLTKKKRIYRTRNRWW